MNIPAHFEFHYVHNGVKQSVTLLTTALFKNARCIDDTRIEKKNHVQQAISEPADTSLYKLIDRQAADPRLTFADEQQRETTHD